MGASPGTITRPNFQDDHGTVSCGREDLLSSRRTGKYTVEQISLWCQQRTGMDHMELARWLRPDLHTYSEGYDQFRQRVGGLIMMLMDSEARSPSL
jgi:hypothetical protein